MTSDRIQSCARQLAPTKRRLDCVRVNVLGCSCVGKTSLIAALRSGYIADLMRRAGLASLLSAAAAAAVTTTGQTAERAAPGYATAAHGTASRRQASSPRRTVPGARRRGRPRTAWIWLEYSLIAKFHYTGPHGPDRTRADPNGPARTLSETRTDQRSYSEIRVRSGPSSGI